MLTTTTAAAVESNPQQPHQRHLQGTRTRSQYQRNTPEFYGRQRCWRTQNNHAGTVRKGDETQSAAQSHTRLFVLESIRLPENKEAAWKVIQWTVRPTAAAEASVQAGKHDGTTDDARPDDVAPRNDAEPDRVHDAAAADAIDATATDDGAHGTNAANDTATAAGRATWENAAANAARRPEISAAAAVGRIRDGITHGDELLTFRGGQTYSFKQ